MSGSSKPGTTFKGKCIEATGETVTFLAGEDAAYFHEGVEYLIHATPVAVDEHPDGGAPQS